MKKLIIACLLFISPIAAVQPSLEQLEERLFYMRYMLENADLYAMNLDFMMWLDGYCNGLSFAIDGKIGMRE